MWQKYQYEEQHISCVTFPSSILEEEKNQIWYNLGYCKKKQENPSTFQMEWWSSSRNTLEFVKDEHNNKKGGYHACLFFKTMNYVGTQL